MNFFASRDFLEAAAAAHFPGRPFGIENFAFGEDVLRLLVVDGRPVTKLLFLDVHEPLASNEIEGPVLKGRFARNVVRGTIPAAAWSQAAYPLNSIAPFIDWSCFVSFEAYYNHILECHRGQMRDRERRWRKLASSYGALHFTADDHAPDVMAAARIWKSRQLRLTGQPDYFDRPAATVFLDELFRRGRLVTSSLRAGETLLSVWIGYIHDGRWSGWIFAFNPEFQKFSVGHRLVLSLLEESFKRGNREFDFSEGAEDYKLMYATHGRLLGDAGRPPLRRAAVDCAKRLFQSAGLLQPAQALKRKLAAAIQRQPPLPERV